MDLDEDVVEEMDLDEDVVEEMDLDEDVLQLEDKEVEEKEEDTTEDSAETDEQKETKEENRGISVKELTEKSKQRNLIEAAMFIAGRPIGIEELSIKLEIGKKEAEELLKDLAFDYMDRITPIEIVQVGEKFSMQIKPEYTDDVKSFTTGGLIPEAVMRTLTIIALKQPIKKSLLVKIRGSGAYQHVKFLEERGFIDSMKSGRTSVLETNDQFSDTFGLSRNKKRLKKQLIGQLGIEGGIKSGEQEIEEQKARKKKLKKKANNIQETEETEETE
ncbi:MAG: SMC-Scp complex subunit ScpB [Candidatus Lokiarchaeota archaeon]|nr:SMC-Scp complex subunit ScpB [Candidatus Lokiarchaeota archaeon]